MFEKKSLYLHLLINFDELLHECPGYVSSIHNDIYCAMKSISPKILFLDRNFLIVLIATVGMLPELLNAGGYYMITDDITTQMLPFVYETKRMFSSGVPFWSWNTYFGDNFIASYAYYTVFNPFTWINCLFPYRYLFLGFTFVLYLKFLVCGYVAQKYLEKMGFGRNLSLLGCLLYTFSSWAISCLCFYMFMEPMILFPLLLIFIERFLKKERYACGGLATATFITVAVNYYFAIGNLIAATAYFFCRLTCFEKSPYARFRISLKAAGCVGIGIACASAILIPVLFQLKDSPHTSSGLDIFNIYLIADRAFWLVYPKAHEGKFFYLLLNSKWNSNAAGIAVFGLLPALLLFTKKGHAWAKWLAAVFCVLYLTPLNGVFLLFTNLYYTRWAYAFTLTIIMCTLYYIKDFGLPGKKYAVWYCLVVYGLYFILAGVSAYWHYHNGGDSASVHVLRLSMDMVLVAANAVALLLLCRRKGKEDLKYGYILGAVTMCLALQFVFYSLPDMKGFPGQRPVMTEAQYFLRGENFRTEGDFTHRTNFTPLNTFGRPPCNFALLTHRPSIEMYHSVQNPKIHKWNDIVGRLDPSRVFYPTHFVKSFEALMSVKDLVVVTDEFTDTVPGIPVSVDGIFRSFESDHYIPMGFAYDQYVLADSIERLTGHDNTLDIPKVLLSSLSIDRNDEEELRPFLRRGMINPSANLDSLVAARRSAVCDSFSGHSRGFDAHISLDSAMVVFFSVVADNGFKAYIDGRPTKIYETNLGFSSVVVPAGSHHISFRFFPEGLLSGLVLSVIGFLILTAMFFKKL